MRNVKINGRDIPIDSRGVSIIFYMDEFGRDILQDAMNFLLNVSSQRPNLSIISKILYTYIKTANETRFKNYRAFMDSFKNITALIDKDNMTAILDETYDLLGIDRTKKEEDEEGKDSKKKEEKTAEVNR